MSFRPRTGTPLRYPGGKQRLTPFIREILVTNDLFGSDYAEPYAGGGGVAVTLLLAGEVSRIHLNDADPRIHAFWTAATTETDRMCRFIERAELSVGAWLRHREVVRKPNEHDFFELGCSTFYLNRCNRSGVLGGGLIGGRSQSGKWLMDARFNRDNLIDRIQALGDHAERISVTGLDAEEFATTWASTHFDTDTLIYFDPPYIERAQSLYFNAYCHEDHARVARTIQEDVGHPWVVSYDEHDAISKLYKDRRAFVHELHYSAARSYKGSEVFIFSDRLQIPSGSTLRSIDDALAAMSPALRPSRIG